tara:strand:+ start:4208 stop:4393 length:186 start_codon:yes stop_codon:yes gene_type:complete
MEKIIYWSDDAVQNNPYKGGMFVRTDLGKTLAKWTSRGLKVVGIAIDDSMEVEFILEVEEE